MTLDVEKRARIQDSYAERKFFQIQETATGAKKALLTIYCMRKNSSRQVDKATVGYPKVAI